MGAVALPLIAAVATIGAGAMQSGMSGGHAPAPPPPPTAPETSVSDEAAAGEEKKRRAAAAEENRTNYTNGLGLGDEADIYKTTLG